jgi:putative ABC transport system ATP-binding protein
VAQEYSVLDRAGRLQIPRDFIDSLGMRDRVLLALEPDHVGVWPDTTTPSHNAGRGGQTEGENRVQGTEGDRR